MNYNLLEQFKKIALDPKDIYLAGANEDGSRPSDGLLAVKHLGLGAAILATVTALTLGAVRDDENRGASVKLSQSAMLHYGHGKSSALDTSGATAKTDAHAPIVEEDSSSPR